MAKSSVNKPVVVFTCEHGGYKVPSQFNHLKDVKSIKSKAHFNWDPGALDLTKFLSHQLKAVYFANSYSRGLIDCNRSDDNPHRFPKWNIPLSSQERTKLEELISHPYKAKVRRFIRAQLNKNKAVVLISVHSFTPEWKGRRRTTDIGLLYRPWEQDEKMLANELQSHLKQLTSLKTHLNLPYRGHTDCFSNELSREFNSPDFTAIMLEVNYRLLHDNKEWKSLQWSLATAMASVLG